MRIVLEDNVAINLEYVVALTGRLEFSGFGFGEVKGDDFVIDDFVILNVGNEGYTEIPAKKMLELANRPDAKRMRVWLHRHPMGSGKPGPENWSSTDNNTILKEPLGSIPELVKWSVSIVRTPRGWVGRIDNYIKKTTKHLEVVPNIKPELMATVDQLMVEKWAKFRKQFQEAYPSQSAQTEKAIVPWVSGQQLALPAGNNGKHRKGTQAVWQCYCGDIHLMHVDRCPMCNDHRDDAPWYYQDAGGNLSEIDGRLVYDDLIDEKAGLEGSIYFEDLEDEEVFGDDFGNSPY